MKKHIKRIIGGVLLSLIFCVTLCDGGAFAMSFTVSPMNQRISLVPGDVFYGSVMVSNPAENTEDFYYIAEVEPFTVSDNNFTVSFEKRGNYNEIVDWIELDEPTGVIEPNSAAEIHFSITVPEDAPAGGQYATIVIKEDSDSSVGEGINITQVFQTAHLIYANIPGDIRYDGEIIETSVSGFLFSGNILASTIVKNNGNTHEDVETILQVFPLFSGEELFTNEETSQENIVLPGASRYVFTEWEKTPMVGIFRVVYTVTFSGLTTTVEKIVIKCPIWLLFIVIFLITVLVLYIINKTKRYRI